MIENNKKPIRCANIKRAINQKLHCYVTPTINQVKGEFVRLVTWLAVIWG